MFKLDDQQFIDLINDQKFPDDNPGGKALILISTPSCIKCKGLYTDENIERAESQIENVRLYYFSFTPNNPIVSQILGQLGLMGVPNGILLDLKKDVLRKPASMFTSTQDIVDFANTLK